MDQNALVNDELVGGRCFLDALNGIGFTTGVAFWARLNDVDRWVLYISSPKVDELGPLGAYQFIHPVLRDASQWGLDFSSVSVLRTDDPMAQAAAQAIQPKPASAPYRGVTRFNGRSLGGVQIDGAFIYPPWEPAANPVG